MLYKLPMTIRKGDVLKFLYYVLLGTEIEHKVSGKLTDLRELLSPAHRATWTESERLIGITSKIVELRENLVYLDSVLADMLTNINGVFQEQPQKENNNVLEQLSRLSNHMENQLKEKHEPTEQ